MADDTGTTAATLEPVRCTGCGVALALTDEPTATCPACGAITPVPELHRTALRAEHEAAALRREAGGATHALGTMPAWPLRVLGSVFATNLRLVFGALFVMFGVGVITLLGVVGVEAIAHVDVFMTVRDDLRDQVGIPLWFGFVLLTVGIGVYGQRRAVSLRGVQAALAARPPATPGGPASCRHCGGPLAIPPDAVDVRCIYCTTDNLVALPAWWVTGLTRSTQTAARELDQAQRTFAAQTAKLRRRMIVVLGFYVVFLGGVLGLAAWSAHGRGPSAEFAAQPKWWNHDGDPRDLMRRHTEGVDQWNDAFAQLSFAPNCSTAPTALPLERRDCDSTGCTLWLYAALRDREHATIQLTGIDADATVEIQAPHFFAAWASGPRDRFGADAGNATLHAGQPLEIVAKWQTWHQMAIRLPGAKPDTTVGVCFAVR